jgi:fused signal recognition particle receptor
MLDAIRPLARWEEDPSHPLAEACEAVRPRPPPPYCCPYPCPYCTLPLFAPAPAPAPEPEPELAPEPAPEPAPDPASAQKRVHLVRGEGQDLSS